MGTAIVSVFLVGFLALVGHALWQAARGPSGQTRGKPEHDQSGTTPVRLPKPSYSAKSRRNAE